MECFKSITDATLPLYTNTKKRGHILTLLPNAMLLRDGPACKECPLYRLLRHQDQYVKSNFQRV